jgi:uncharacterized membrane protein YcfT
MADKQRHDWVDAAKGLSIILVVMMYSAFNVGEYTGDIGVLHYVIGFATPFRMPEFFLISGLFLSNVIARDWLHYSDRRIVHYFYFYALWAAIDIVLKIGIVGHDIPGMVHGLALAVVEPYGVLWFIYMLGVFSIAAKLAWQFKVPPVLIIVIAAALQMSGFQSASYIVTQFCAYFVFFYLGYIAAPLVFRIVGLAERHPRLAVGGLLIWALIEGFLVFWPNGTPHPMGMEMGLAAFPPLHLALAIAGAIALCVFGMFLMRFAFMEWLRWLGEHSLVVYLAFTLPMSAVRIIAMKSGLVTGTSALSVLVLLTSTAAPVVLYLLAKRFGVGGFLFKRPAWAHIPGTPGSSSARPVLKAAE